MTGFKGERTLMRVHIGENDRWHGRPLYEAIVELLRAEHFAGATVFRGILGFGASARTVHRSSVFHLSSDLPIVVESVETEEKIAGILPRLDEMLGGGLITLEKVRVIMYRADLPMEERTGSWPISTES
jgi:PII-like signaling protein